MLAVYGPHSWFYTKQRNSFFNQIWWFFTIKTRFWQYYSLLKMRKLHFNDEFLVLVGPIISRFFCIFKWGKNKPKQQMVCALVLSLCKDVITNQIYLMKQWNNTKISSLKFQLSWFHLALIIQSSWNLGSWIIQPGWKCESIIFRAKNIWNFFHWHNV